jgi:hypothetical protein
VSGYAHARQVAHGEQKTTPASKRKSWQKEGLLQKGF